MKSKKLNKRIIAIVSIVLVVIILITTVICLVTKKYVHQINNKKVPPQLVEELSDHLTKGWGLGFRRLSITSSLERVLSTLTVCFRQALFFLQTSSHRMVRYTPLTPFCSRTLRFFMRSPSNVIICIRDFSAMALPSAKMLKASSKDRPLRIRLFNSLAAFFVIMSPFYFCTKAMPMYIKVV